MPSNAAAAANVITGEDVFGMVGHWLSVDPNGYLGSSYGSDPQSLLQSPQQSSLADAFIVKMQTDIPLIAALPNGDVDLFAQDNGFEKKDLIISVGGGTISLNTLNQSILNP